MCRKKYQKFFPTILIKESKYIDDRVYDKEDIIELVKNDIQLDIIRNICKSPKKDGKEFIPNKKIYKDKDMIITKRIKLRKVKKND